VTGEIGGLFGVRLKAINVGLPLFADALRQQGVEVVEVDWQPPAGGDTDLLALLDRLNQTEEDEEQSG
jgi:hypothetical protein